MPIVPYLLGAAALLVAVLRGDFAGARGSQRLAVLGPLCFAVPMAVFGGDHFTFANIAQIIPAWIPWHAFWRWFVGACLVAGGFAIAARTRDTLALGLFGLMMWLFVVLMHIPVVIQAPGNRFTWAVASRDATFGAGALAFTALRARGIPPARVMRVVARWLLGIACLFWAVEVVLHRDFRPGIPLRQVNPSWLPFQTALAWLTAAALEVAGLGLLFARHARRAAILLGLTFVALAVVLGIPITVAAPADIGGINYLMDNLMMAGSAFCLAAACGAFIPAFPPSVPTS